MRLGSHERPGFSPWANLNRMGVMVHTYNASYLRSQRERTSNGAWSQHNPCSSISPSLQDFGHILHVFQATRAGILTTVGHLASCSLCTALNCWASSKFINSQFCRFEVQCMGKITISSSLYPFHIQNTFISFQHNQKSQHTIASIQNLKSHLNLSNSKIPILFSKSSNLMHSILEQNSYL